MESAEGPPEGAPDHLNFRDSASERMAVGAPQLGQPEGTTVGTPEGGPEGAQEGGPDHSSFRDRERMALDASHQGQFTGTSEGAPGGSIDHLSFRDRDSERTAVEASQGGQPERLAVAACAGGQSEGAPSGAPHHLSFREYCRDGEGMALEASQQGQSEGTPEGAPSGAPDHLSFREYCRAMGVPAYDLGSLQRGTPHRLAGFVPFYLCDVGGTPGNDHCLYRHPNGLVVVAVAPGHLALRGGQSVREIDFNVGRRNRHTELEVSGKQKKNAWRLEANSALCKVILSDDASFTLRCCLKGSLLEVNKRLAAMPSLLSAKSGAEGYIAVIMPKDTDWMTSVPTLTEDEYRQRLVSPV